MEGVSYLTIFFLLLAVFMIFMAHTRMKLLGYKNIKVEAERLLKLAEITNEKESRDRLAAYFGKMEWRLYGAIFYYILAFCLLTLGLFSIKNSPNPSPVWQVFLVIGFFFIQPVANIIISFVDLKSLKLDMVSKLLSRNQG